MKVDPLVVVRGMRPGMAATWLEKIDGQDTLVFGAREESRRIRSFGPAVETELRAAAERVGDALVVPVVLRLGPTDPAGHNLYELWLNAHAPDLPTVFALSRQTQLVIRLFGDEARLERTLGCPNSRRQFFVAASLEAARLPAWSMEAFDRARAKLEARHPSVQSLWEALAATPTARVCLWEFPEADFADWLRLIGPSELTSYQQYLTMLAALQADQEHHGIEVTRVRFTVAEMRQELQAHGLSNTPDGRAAVTAFRVDRR